MGTVSCLSHCPGSSIVDSEVTGLRSSYKLWYCWASIESMALFENASKLAAEIDDSVRFWEQFHTAWGWRGWTSARFGGGVQAGFANAGAWINSFRFPVSRHSIFAERFIAVFAYRLQTHQKVLTVEQFQVERRQSPFSITNSRALPQTWYDSSRYSNEQA